MTAKMKSKITILIAILITGCSTSKMTSTKSDKYCSSEVENYYEAKFDLKMDTSNFCDFILQGGVPYQISQENCKSLPHEDYLIDYIHYSENTVIDKNCDRIMLLVSKDLQTFQEKRTLLQELIKEYSEYKDISNDYRCPKCKVVLIDGKAGFPYQTREKLNKMNAKDIRFIKIYDKPMNSIIYGIYGKENGIIEIEMK